GSGRGPAGEGRCSPGSGPESTRGSRRPPSGQDRAVREARRVAVERARAGQLRVEGGGEDAALPHDHGLAVVARQDLDVRPEGDEPRSADEDALEGAAERG